MKLLVVYHSGVGNTKFVAEILYHKLLLTNDVELKAVEDVIDGIRYDDFDGFIFGFPTYHVNPSVSMTNFLDHIEKVEDKKPVYIFTTCGWFSANSTRIFAKSCLDKNFIPVLSRSFRCPGTDGVLLAPYIRFFYTFEKKLLDKIEIDVNEINKVFSPNPRVNMPKFSWASVLNYPNMKLGQAYTFNINLHKENCIKCGKCIKHCNVKGLILGDNGYPIFNKDNCEKCYRCIHHCSENALSLSKKKMPNRLLTQEFYDSYLKKLRL